MDIVHENLSVESSGRVLGWAMSRRISGVGKDWRRRIPFMRHCVVLVSCNHSFNERSHSVSVPGATGLPEAERPKGRKQPAQVKKRRMVRAIR